MDSTFGLIQGATRDGIDDDAGLTVSFKYRELVDEFSRTFINHQFDLDGRDIACRQSSVMSLNSLLVRHEWLGAPMPWSGAGV